MTTVLFDTLALARKLEQAGFPSDQAQATSAALAEVLGAEVATTRDLEHLQTHLEAKIDQLGRELKGEIEGLRTEMHGLRAEMRGEIGGVRGEIESLRTETHAEIGSLRGEIEGLRTEMHAEISGLRRDMSVEIEGLRTEMRGEIGNLHGEIGGLRGEIDGLRGEVDGLRGEMARMEERIEHRLTIRLGGIMAAGIGVIAVLVGLF